MQTKELKDIKLWVSTDMEGVSGAIYGGFNLPKSKEVERCELLMTLELNALIQGAREFGVQNFMVDEAHPFNRDYLESGLEIVKDYSRIGECHYLAFLGQHARAGVVDGVLSHTGSSRSILEFRVNGMEYGEFGITTAFAGYHGVPVIFFSGDRAGVVEALELCPEIITVAVEEGMGNHSAICLAPQKAQRLIREGMATALANRAHVKPLRLNTPVTFEMELKYPAIADRYALIPGVERKGKRGVRWTCADFMEAYKTYQATCYALAWWDSKS